MSSLLLITLHLPRFQCFDPTDLRLIFKEEFVVILTVHRR